MTEDITKIAICILKEESVTLQLETESNKEIFDIIVHKIFLVTHYFTKYRVTHIHF